MKKLLFMLALLATFTACNIKHHKKTKLHSYEVEDDNGEVFYWYMFYGQNNTYYTYNSRTPLTDFVDIAWQVSDYIPTPIATAKELPVTELEDNAVDEATEEAVDADSSGDSGSGDSGAEMVVVTEAISHGR